MSKTPLRFRARGVDGRDAQNHRRPSFLALPKSFREVKRTLFPRKHPSRNVPFDVTREQTGPRDQVYVGDQGRPGPTPTSKTHRVVEGPLRTPASLLVSPPALGARPPPPNGSRATRRASSRTVVRSPGQSSTGSNTIPGLSLHVAEDRVPSGTVPPKILAAPTVAGGKVGTTLSQWHKTSFVGKTSKVFVNSSRIPYSPCQVQDSYVSFVVRCSAEELEDKMTLSPILLCCCSIYSV